MSDPENQEFENIAHSNDETAASLKEKIASQSVKGGDVAQEDTSRSALHYGENQTAEPERETREGAGLGGADNGVSSDTETQTSPEFIPEGTDDGSVGTSADQPADVGAENLSASNSTEASPSRGRRSRASDPDDSDALQLPDDAPPSRVQQTDPISAESQNPTRPSAAAHETDAEVVAPNLAPSAIVLDQVTLSENEEGAAVGRLSIIDPNADDEHEVTLSDDRFEIVDGEVRLKPGITLDHEAEGSISLQITATDGAGASHSQSFEITVNDVNEAPTELSLEGGLIAANQAGAVVGKIDITDQDQGDTHQFTVSDERFEVADGFLKLREDAIISDEELGTIDLQITATDSGGATISNTFEFDAVDAADVSLSSGFHASYFDVDHSLRQLDQIDWSGDPTHEEIVTDINYKNSSGSFWEGGARDTFGAKITGNIDVEEGGSFDFFLGGDDGAVLFIDGVEVIDNDGLHSYHTRTAEVDLEPGTHTIEVRYFENYGHAGLKLEWDGPGTDGRELVVANDDLSVAENGMIPVNIGGGDVSDQASVQISGLPADTILISDDNVLVADGGDVDLTGWDLTLLEIAPPAGFEGMISGEIATTDRAFNGQEVTGSESFSIGVGDVNAMDTERGDETSPELLETQDDGTQSDNWVAASESEPPADGDNDDVMSENVEQQGAEEQGYDVTETYERQDW